MRLYSFDCYDTNGDDYINFDEFTALCDEVFGDEYEFRPLDVFRRLARGRPNLVVTKFYKWIESVYDPDRSALLVIDVQNDFIDGSLALRESPAGEDGLEVLEPINRMIDEAEIPLTVYSKGERIGEFRGKRYARNGSSAPP